MQAAALEMLEESPPAAGLSSLCRESPESPRRSRRSPPIAARREPRPPNRFERNAVQADIGSSPSISRLRQALMGSQVSLLSSDTVETPAGILV
jgi:hypothetical protein